jgi:hypothetical protein
MDNIPEKPLFVKSTRNISRVGSNLDVQVLLEPVELALYQDQSFFRLQALLDIGHHVCDSPE